MPDAAPDDVSRPPGRAAHRSTSAASTGRWVLLAACYATALLVGRDLGAAALPLAWLPVVFAFWHLFTWVGWRVGLLVFAVIAVVSFSFEALGVATGLVFGNYYYPAGPLGPLLLGVPPLIQLQYFAMGYACLLLGRAIGGVLWGPARGWQLVGVSAMSAFAMTALDLASDPMQSTVLGDWIWRDGGAYFGVPVHNFIGWFVVTGTFFLIVNAILARRPAVDRAQRRRDTGFYLQGLLLFGTFIAPVMLRPVLDGQSTIALAMAGVAAFAALPLLLAALLGLRRP